MHKKKIIRYIILFFLFLFWNLIINIVQNDEIWSFGFTYNLLIGALLGLFYALFELPNSFLKRRLDIKPGKTIKGKKILV